MELLLAFVLSFFPTISYQIGNSYMFWPGGTDPGNPVSHGACVRRDLKLADHGIAHRTLPCKSKVLIVNLQNGRSTWAKVVDRGPYGRNRHGFRGVVDLLPSVDRAIKARGNARVAVISFH